MKQPVLLRWLPTAALLLTLLLGCSKKADPAASSTSTPLAASSGSYTIDGRLVKCQVTAVPYIYTPVAGQLMPADHVDVQFLTTPEPPSGREILQLSYNRTSATVPFQLYTMYFFTKNSLSLSGAFTSTAATLTLNSDGSYSGTFAGQGQGSAPAYLAVSAGVFANARP